MVSDQWCADSSDPLAQVSHQERLVLDGVVLQAVLKPSSVQKCVTMVLQRCYYSVTMMLL